MNKNLCVFVFNQRNEPLMPTTQRKARILLKEKKALIKVYNPFTIQLTTSTGESKQKVNVGIDTGSKHVGFAVTSNNNVLYKGEVELRQDVSDKILTKAQCRRTRRYRNTRYRPARWLNRVSSKKEGWLPPSIKSRIDNQFNWIDKICSLLPNPELHIEVGKFDVAKIINPDIHGEEYQNGVQKGYYNVRYYVFARDEYKCQICKKKGKVLHTHHIIYRSKGGTDKPDNLITVCSDCHNTKNHQPGGILYKLCEKALKGKNKIKQYKEPPFMNIVRRLVFKEYPNAILSYGSDTAEKRHNNTPLSKTHYNDAIIISGIDNIKNNIDECMIIRQYVKKSRVLHVANCTKGGKRKSQTKPFKRNGFCPNDFVKVKLKDGTYKNGYLVGFTNDCVYVKDENNKYINVGKAKQISTKYIDKVICHNNNWQYYIFKLKKTESE